VVDFVSLNIGVWINCFLVDVRITYSVFDAKPKSLATLVVDPSPTYGSFSLGVLGERLVVGFLGGIFCKHEK
jgi:hypothetical protein